MNGKRVVVVIGVLAAAGLGYAAMKGFFPPKGGLEGTIGAAQRYQSGQITDKDVALQDQELQALLQSDVFHQLQTDPAYQKGFEAIAASKAFEEAAKTRNFKGLDMKVAEELAAKATSIEEARHQVAVAQKHADELEKRRAIANSKVTPDELSKAQEAVAAAKGTLETLAKSDQIGKGSDLAEAQKHVVVVQKRVDELERTRGITGSKVTAAEISNAHAEVEAAKKTVETLEKADQTLQKGRPVAEFAAKDVAAVVQSHVFQDMLAKHGAALSRAAQTEGALSRALYGLGNHGPINKADQAQAEKKADPASTN